MSIANQTEGEAPSQDIIPGDSRQTAKLPSRGIGAKPCKQCCERIQTVTERELTGLLGQMIAESLDGGTAEGEEAVLAFIPPGRPTILPKPVTRVPPAVRLLPARLIPVGGVIIGGAVLIEAIVAKTVALDTLSAVATLLDEYFKSQRQSGDCESCVRDRMWGQDRVQVKEKGVTIRRRL